MTGDGFFHSIFDMEIEYVKYESDAEWVPHPAGIKGVYMKILRSRKDAGYREGAR